METRLRIRKRTIEESDSQSKKAENGTKKLKQRDEKKETTAGPKKKVMSRKSPNNGPRKNKFIKTTDSATIENTVKKPVAAKRKSKRLSYQLQRVFSFDENEESPSTSGTSIAVRNRKTVQSKKVVPLKRAALKQASPKTTTVDEMQKQLHIVKENVNSEISDKKQEKKFFKSSIKNQIVFVDTKFFDAKKKPVKRNYYKLPKIIKKVVNKEEVPEEKMAEKLITKEKNTAKKTTQKQISKKKSPELKDTEKIVMEEKSTEVDMKGNRQTKQVAFTDITDEIQNKKSVPFKSAPLSINPFRKTNAFSQTTIKNDVPEVPKETIPVDNEDDLNNDDHFNNDDHSNNEDHFDDENQENKEIHQTPKNNETAKNQIKVVSKQVLSEKERIPLSPRKKQKSVNPFRKTTVFSQKSPTNDFTSLKELNRFSPLKERNIVDNTNSPLRKFSSYKSIVQSTPINNAYFERKVLGNANQISTPRQGLQNKILQPSVKQNEHTVQKENRFDRKISPNKQLREKRGLKNKNQQSVVKQIAVKENIEPLKENQIVVEAVIEKPPSKVVKAPVIPLRENTNQNISNSSDNVVPDYDEILNADDVTTIKEKNGNLRVLEKNVQKPDNNVNLNGISHADNDFEMTNDDRINNVDDIPNIEHYNDTVKIHVEIPKTVEEVEKLAPTENNNNIFDVENAFGFDITKQTVDFDESKLNSDKALKQKKQPLKCFANLKKSTHSPTVKYLVKAIENEVYQVEEVQNGSNKESFTDNTSLQDWSNTFDVDSFSAKENNTVNLFDNVKEPTHFGKPAVHSYTRKRNVSYSSEEEDDYENDEDIEEKKMKKRKVTQKKKIKKEKTRKVSPEELRWMNEINQSFEDVDKFELIVE